MGFIDQTIAWCRGEIFEGKMSLLYGAVVLLVSLAFWKFGKTPAARGIFIPLLVIALLFVFIGAYLVIQNQARIPAYSQAYAQDPAGFVKTEQARTEAFIKWYPTTFMIASGLILVGLVLFGLLSGPNGRGIALGLVLLGFSVIFLDHFSEERAGVYHQAISAEMERLPAEEGG